MQSVPLVADSGYCIFGDMPELWDITKNIENQINKAFEKEDVQPVKRGRWEQIGEQSAKCAACGGFRILYFW